MREQIKIGFQYQWPTFSLEVFRAQFPFVFNKYDLVISSTPEVVFYSIFSPQNERCWPDRRLWLREMPVLPKGKCVRVFITGENVEPQMELCDFAITFSTMIDNPNHLRLPLWVYDIRRWGFSPASLIKGENDWEKVAAQKKYFCNFIYSHSVAFRNSIFRLFDMYRHVDSPGECENNYARSVLPKHELGKIAFITNYKFTLAIENTIWPGYVTEKLVQPMLVNSIPIYIGDPLAARTFNTASYIDITAFESVKHMIEFVKEVDNDNNLYLRILSTPFYHDNKVPQCASDTVTMSFFERIWSEVKRRR